MSRRLPGLFRSIFLLFIFFLSFGHFNGPVYSAEPSPLALCTEDTVRIMPLGDSITAGSSSGTPVDPQYYISYRKDLWELLESAGYEGSIDFVGSQQGGQFYAGDGFDVDHEGYPGMTDAWIAQRIYNNTGSPNFLGDLGSNWPHIILLHIGTNLLDTSPADVETILNEIDEYEDNTGNHITVILARIIDMIPNSPTLHTFNNNVQAMAEARTGDDIVIVDMEDGAGIIYAVQPDGDMANNLHPWETGYTKMAEQWMIALENVFTNCNNQPQITNPGSQISTEGSNSSLQIEASDQDAGQTLTFGQTGLPPNLTIDPATGLISGTISSDAAIDSPYDVTVTVEDNGMPTRNNSTSFEWKVNRPPSASDDVYITTEEINLPVPAGGVLDNDSDVNGDTLSAIIVGGPEHGGLSLSANGAFTYSPDPNYSGMDTFTYQADDGHDLSNVATVTITVENVNDAPVAQNQSLATDEDVPLPVILLVDDPDTGDVLSYTILNQPDHGTLSGAAPNLTYTPDLNYSGPDSFTFKANDGTVDSNQATVSLAVSAVNDLDVTNPGSQISNEEESISLRIQVVDAEADNLSFQMSGAPPGLSIDENTGLISGKINAGASHGSPYLVTVTVSDGNDSVPVVFSWFVDEKTWLFLPMVTTK